MILTGVPGSELRLQVAEDTQQIVSAMLIIETIVEAPAGTKERVQSYSSALELGAYAAPRSGGLWTELREEIAEGPPKPVAPSHWRKARSASSCVDWCR